MSEHDEQAALLAWAATRLTAIPELEYLFAVPNGGKRSQRDAGEKLAEGLKAGVPDLFLPVARQGRHGLWLELKINGGRLTADQLRWRNWLEQQGYRAEVCVGWQRAAALIEHYMGVPKEQRTEFWE